MGRKEECHIRIKKAMNLRGLTQSDIVEKTNIKKSALSQYISGKITPRQNAIDELSKVLNVSEPWLMGYDVPMRDNKLTTFEKKQLIESIKDKYRRNNKNTATLLEDYKLEKFDVNISDSVLLKIAKDLDINTKKNKYLNKIVISETRSWFLNVIESLTDEELKKLKPVVETTIEIINNKILK